MEYVSKRLCIISIVIVFNIAYVENVNIGYILYCPCMGRFGNQADHFLGALGFAKGLNRTLVLPAWIEYIFGEPKSIQVPFDRYFKVEPLREFHHVITMEEFMEKYAHEIWPQQKRIAFCYMSRGDSNSCNAKEGNPFGPFWNHYNVDFVGSEFYGPLHYDIHHHDMNESWAKKYPPEEWPVLAFTGAPASFPVQLENRHLQKFLLWSDNITKEASNFIQTKLPKGPFVGIHLRNGLDWTRACDHVPQSTTLFAAPQCVGYRNEFGYLTLEMCFPSTETIIKQLKRVIKSVKAKSVFVASDNNYMMSELRESLKRMDASVHRLDKPDTHLDLAILGKSNHFIGNCVSSFSAFVKRERDVMGFASSFWAFPTEKSTTKVKHDEF